jgi:hypothetical protein
LSIAQIRAVVNEAMWYNQWLHRTGYVIGGYL